MKAKVTAANKVSLQQWKAMQNTQRAKRRAKLEAREARKAAVVAQNKADTATSALKTAQAKFKDKSTLYQAAHKKQTAAETTVEGASKQIRKDTAQRDRAKSLLNVAEQDFQATSRNARNAKTAAAEAADVANAAKKRADM